MALQPTPQDPYQPDFADDDVRSSTRMEEDLQIDPELSEGRVSGGRVVAYAVAIVLVLGAVYYGMNASSTNAPSTASQSTNENTAQTSTQPGQPAIRDVTPYNSQPGTTTGAAPVQPQTPPANAPTGADLNRPGSGSPGANETR